MFRGLFLLLFLAQPAFSEGEREGDFDHYVLALSWTPSWCEVAGDKRNSDQCKENTGFGFTLHGLWPQYENGWPSFCKTSDRPPSRSMTSEMADIMGTSGLAWHQWKKHGTCTGLSAKEYFSLSRKAYEKLNRPEILRQLNREVDIQASVIRDAFLEANPTLNETNLEITCKSGNIQEARICLNKDLIPLKCTQSRGSCAFGRTYDLPPIR